MTVTALARIMYRADRYQKQFSEPELPNGSLPPPGHVNPHCPPGLDITGMKPSDFKIIPVSQEVEQQVRDIAFDAMKNYYGMSGPDGNSLGDAIKAYYPKVPVEDRKHAAHTLHKIHHDESVKLVNFVKSRIPGWKVGVPFDTKILDEYQRGIDTRA